MRDNYCNCKCGCNLLLFWGICLGCDELLHGMLDMRDNYCNCKCGCNLLLFWGICLGCSRGIHWVRVRPLTTHRSETVQE
jgi:hypothetical protein